MSSSQLQHLRLPGLQHLQTPELTSQPARPCSAPSTQSEAATALGHLLATATAQSCCGLVSLLAAALLDRENLLLGDSGNRGEIGSDARETTGAVFKHAGFGCAGAGGS